MNALSHSLCMWWISTYRRLSLIVSFLPLKFLIHTTRLSKPEHRESVAGRGKLSRCSQHQTVNKHLPQNPASTNAWDSGNGKSEISQDFRGQVVRKPVNANPGLKVNRSINVSCIKVFFASYFLFSLRLFKFKREGQTIKQKTSPKSCKTENQNSR